MTHIQKQTIDRRYVVQCQESASTLSDRINNTTPLPQRDSERSSSQQLSKMHETEMSRSESSDCEQSQEEDKKSKCAEIDITHQHSRKSREVYMKSQMGMSQSGQKISQLKNVEQKRGNDQTEQAEKVSSGILQKLFEIYQQSLIKHGITNKAITHQRDKLYKQLGEKESSESDVIDITYSTDQICKNLQKIAMKLGSSAWTYTKESSPVSKRTRKQRKIQRKIKEQSLKQEQVAVKLDKQNKTSTQQLNNRSQSKDKRDEHSNSQILQSIRKNLFVQVVEETNSQSQKRKRGRPKRKVSEQHKEEGVINSKNKESISPIRKSISPVSLKKSEKSQNIRLLEIRQIEKLNRNHQEYLLNFCDGSFQVLPTDELVKLWPEEFAKYLTTKGKSQ